MKSFKLLIIILSLLISSCVYSQTVSATFFNLPQQKVYLDACSGLYVETIDSVMMSQDKRVEFNTPLTKGMYLLKTEYGPAVEFLYDEAPVKMIVKNIYDNKSIEFIGSQANSDWHIYEIVKEQTFKSLNVLKPILREFDAGTAFYADALEEYSSLQDDFMSFTDSLILHDNYASVLIRTDRFMPLNLKLDFKSQREELIANFFNDVDFKDESLIPTDVLTQKIFDFLSIQLTKEQNEDQQIMALILGSDNVFNRAAVDFEMYKFVYQFLIETFKELHIEDVVDYLTRIPYSEEIECTEEQYQELLSIAEFNSRASIGSLAENISGKTIFDEDFSLYDIDNKYTIVYFWSYTCDHCRQNIKDLKSFLDENPNFSLVAVSVKGELKKIKNIVKKNKIKAYFYHDGLEWDCPYVDDYAVTATPSFYLLDKDKKIVYKPFDFKELVDFVNLIIKQ